MRVLSSLVSGHSRRSLVHISLVKVLFSVQADDFLLAVTTTGMLCSSVSRAAACWRSLTKLNDACCSHVGSSGPENAGRTASEAHAHSFSCQTQICGPHEAVIAFHNFMQALPCGMCMQCSLTETLVRFVVTCITVGGSLHTKLPTHVYRCLRSRQPILFSSLQHTTAETFINTVVSQRVFDKGVAPRQCRGQQAKAHRPSRRQRCARSAARQWVAAYRAAGDRPYLQ